MCKIRTTDGKIAADLFIFVDDLCPTGLSRVECWKAESRAAQICNNRGVQDASRKRRDNSQTPGAWAGAIVQTDQGRVVVLFSQDKWAKTKQLLVETKELIDKDSNKLPRKRLEQIRGFLNYVAQTYELLALHLIGYHITIMDWRKNRDQDGWRLTAEHLRRRCLEGVLEDNEEEEDLEAPKFVKTSPRLISDVNALLKLSASSSPPLKRFRSGSMSHVYYGFGDASGTGFGATFQIGNKILFEYRQWCMAEAEASSSNWRELCNLVCAFQAVCKQQDMNGSEVFLFTDNTTAENAYWKGTSKSRLLSDLVLELKLIAIHHDISLHMIHVSGKRMIAQGTDGLS